MKISFLCIFLFTILTTPCLGDPIGRFTDVKGDVSIKRIKTFIRPNINDPVQIKDLVITGDIARTKLMLIDSSLLTIGSKTRVEITDFLLDRNTRKSIILVKNGAIHAKAEKFFDPNSRFEIRTPTAVIGARGTEWFAASSEYEETTIFSISDTVKVYNPAYPNQPVDIKEGYFTKVEPGKLPKMPEAYCPSELYSTMKQWGAEEALKTQRRQIVNHAICKENTRNGYEKDANY